MKNQVSSTTDNVLLIVAVIAVVVSIVGAGMTYNYISAFRSKLTGFATSGGWINLTVNENVAINFTFPMVNWSSGKVNDGETNAELDTSNQSAGNITRGSWKSNVAGLVIQNIGNKNVTIALKASNDNGTFIGGTAANGPLYRWRVRTNESISCLFNSTAANNNTWKDVNTSGTSGTLFCDYFYYEDSRDEIRIDFFVRVPSDSITGDRGSSITATFAAAT